VPDDNKAVACARSIHASMGLVGIASDRFLGQAYWSRALRRRIRLPHPKLNGAAYVEEASRRAAEHGWNVVVPLNDYTAHALVENRARLSPSLAAVLPEPEAWEISKDKLRTARLAASLGLHTPLTFCPRDEQEAAEAARATGYPCVVKLRAGCGAVGQIYARNAEELRQVFRAPRPVSDSVFDFEHLLVQQWIDGEPQDVCAVFAHGEPRGVYLQKKVRTWPVDGGRATIVETIENPDVRRAGLALMSALRWHGPIETEFRVERATGKPYLLEINGRFWATVGLSVAAGLDFPMMYCRLALEGDVPPAFQYPLGVRYRYPVPFALITALKSHDRWQVLRDFLGPRRNAFSDLSWRDPAPVLAEHVYLAWRAWKRRSIAPDSQPRRTSEAQ
jgi:predicted ATP-grasp superfamily ATP-dependent carboligase